MGQCEGKTHFSFALIDVKLSNHYVWILDYTNEILRSNPISIVQVGVNVNLYAKYFSRIYE